LLIPAKSFIFYSGCATVKIIGDHYEKDYTLVTIPDVGHWTHHESADLVTGTMKWWLKMRQ